MAENSCFRCDRNKTVGGEVHGRWGEGWSSWCGIRVSNGSDLGWTSPPMAVFLSHDMWGKLLDFLIGRLYFHPEQSSFHPCDVSTWLKNQKTNQFIPHFPKLPFTPKITKIPISLSHTNTSLLLPPPQQSCSDTIDGMGKHSSPFLPLRRALSSLDCGMAS